METRKFKIAISIVTVRTANLGMVWMKAGRDGKRKTYYISNIRIFVFFSVIIYPSCLYLSAPRFNLTALVGAKTVTAVDEFWTAARSDPLTAAMAATSCVRLAEVATESRVLGGGGASMANEEPSRRSRTRRGEVTRDKGDIFKTVSRFRSSL